MYFKIVIHNICIASVVCLTFSTKCRYIGSGGRDQIVKIWDLKSKPDHSPLICSLPGHSAGITAITFGANEGYIVSSNYSGELLAHNVQQKKLAFTLQPVDPVKAIRCLHNSTFKKHYIVSGNDKGDVDIWDCRTGQVYIYIYIYLYIE